MGILNVTPDSFADGGVRFDAERAIDDGLRMIDDGADILDVGGESTRPGADALPADEELRRVLPVVERLAGAGVPVSIDTYKAVAREAVARGASIVNDVSGLQFDPELGRAVAGTRAALVLVHNRGRSREMYKEAVYGDAPAEIAHEALVTQWPRYQTWPSSSIPGLASRSAPSTPMRRWRTSTRLPDSAGRFCRVRRGSHFSKRPSATKCRATASGAQPRLSQPA